MSLITRLSVQTLPTRSGMILVITIILSSRYYPLFEEVGTEFVIRTGNILYMQGDRSSNLYLVKSGRVRMFYIGENGKVVTYRIIGEGAIDRWSRFFEPFAASNHFSSNGYNSHHLLDSSAVSTYLSPPRTEPAYLWTVVGKLYTALQETLCCQFHPPATFLFPPDTEAHWLPLA